MSTLTLPPMDDPEGHLRVEIKGQEPFFIPFMDYVTVDQIGTILELQDALTDASTPKQSLEATTALLTALGMPIVQKLPAGHLVAIMRSWQAGPGDAGESDGSETSASEPTEEPSNIS